MSHRVGSSSLFSSALARGPSGDGSGGEPTRADEVLGEVWSEVPLRWTRCGQDNPDGRGNGSCQRRTPPSFGAIFFPSFPSSQSKKRGRGTGVPQHLKERQKCIKGTRRAHGSRRGEGDTWFLRRKGRMHSAHGRDPPPTQPSPNHGLSQFRPCRHHFISSCCFCCCLWAQHGRPEGVGGAMHCSGLTAQAAFGTFVLLYLLSDWEHCFFFWAPFSRVLSTWHRQSRSLAGCRSRDTALTPAIHERTGRLDGIQNRSVGAQRHCCRRLFLSETNGLREGARACGHPIPSQPGPDPTWGVKGGKTERRRSQPVVLVSGKLGGATPSHPPFGSHFPATEPLHCPAHCPTASPRSTVQGPVLV